MSCSIKSIRESDVYDATEKFIGKSTRFKEKQPGVVFMPVDQKFTRDQLYKIALSNSKRVSKWASNKYGPIFSNSWVHIDTTSLAGITARIDMPNALLQALYVKEGTKSLEEVNSDPTLFTRDLDFFRGDKALLEQESKSDAEYYAELGSSFVTLKPQSEGANLFYDGTKEWEHDTSNDTDKVVNDDQVFRVMNNKKMC